MATKEKTIAAGWKGNENLYDDFCNQIIKLTDTNNWFSYLEFQRRLFHYSYSNTVLIYCQSKKATNVASAAIWKKQNRTINEKARPIKVWVPIFPKPTEADKKNPNYKPRPFFILGDVYDVSDTKGDIIPTVAHPLDSLTRPQLFSQLSKIAAKNKIKVIASNSSPSEYGDYQKKNNTITLSNDLTLAMKTKTIASLLAKALILNNPKVDPKAKDLIEMQSESVAYLVCGTNGLDSSQYSLGYVAKWASQGGVLSENTLRKRLTQQGKPIQALASSIIKQIDQLTLDSSLVL